MTPDASDARTDTNRADVRDGSANDVVDATTNDAGMDAAPDTGMDAAPDTTMMETGTDAGMDAGTDAAPDARADALSDVPGDGSPSSQIAAVRAATPGAVDLPVNNVLVTYVVPGATLADGGVAPNDPPGFFVQAERTGPAIFVAVDPATLTPRPTVGDQVSFRVTMTSTARTMAVWATSITGYTRSSMGNPVAPLVQDLSAAADLVTGLAGYESELIHLAGTVATDFASAGTGFESAQITTTGMPTAMTNLRLRMPIAVLTSVGLRNGCTFTLDSTGLWRFNAQAQPSAWAASDIMVGTCPPLDAGMEAGVDAATDAMADSGSADGGVDGGVDGGADVVPTDGGTAILVVNEVQTRGSAGGASDEFVEIYNRGTAAISLAGYTIRYASAGSETTGSLSWTGEAGLVIPAGGYVVAANSAFTGTVAAGATRSATALTAGMADAGGQVALLDPSGTRVDSVAYGTITATAPMFREGTTAAPIPTTGMPIVTARIPNGTDTNNNGSDFASRNSNSPGGPNS